MSEPQSIREYLALLNASLEMGFRSRRQVFVEVVDHLSQARDEELRAGASAEQAQRRAIAAFGPPEEVAASFESGFLGALDRRLALTARWLHLWTAQRPRNGAAVILALAIVLAAVVGVLAASFGAAEPFAAGSLVVGGMCWALWCAAPLAVLRRKRDRIEASRGPDEFSLGFQGAWCYLWIIDPHLDAWFIAWLTVPAAASLFFLFVSRGAVKLAARRSSAGTDEERRQAWCANHPWWGALPGVATVPAGLLALVLLHPGPAGLRMVLAALLAAVTALLFAGVRLEHARELKDAYQRDYEASR